VGATKLFRRDFASHWGGWDFKLKMMIFKPAVDLRRVGLGDCCIPSLVGSKSG